LRQYGPGTGIFPRVATADHMLGPYHVKKGTLVTVGVVENFYNPKLMVLIIM
jgi:cytochrome P450